MNSTGGKGQGTSDDGGVHLGKLPAVLSLQPI
jgi:hypothetical protein